jgi:hypothetical protein
LKEEKQNGKEKKESTVLPHLCIGYAENPDPRKDWEKDGEGGSGQGEPQRWRTRSHSKKKVRVSTSFLSFEAFSTRRLLKSDAVTDSYTTLLPVFFLALLSRCSCAAIPLKCMVQKGVFKHTHAKALKGKGRIICREHLRKKKEKREKRIQERQQQR